MHAFSIITALGAFVATVAAVPMKRDLIVDTVTEYDIVTEYATETVWVDATSTWTATVVQQYYTEPAPAPTSVATTSAYVALAAASTTLATQTQAATTPSTTSPTTVESTTSSTTSVYVAPPAPTTSVYVAPPAPTTTSTYVAPVPTTTDVPPATTTAVPAPVTTTAAPVATTAATSSGSSQTYTGQITYYDVGLGSCGQTNTDSEMVVAMAHGMMDKATMCGKTITISYAGSTHQATVVDTCMSCVNGDLDMSPTLFKAVAPNGDGRVSGVSWSFN